MDESSELNTTMVNKLNKHLNKPIKISPKGTSGTLTLSLRTLFSIEFVKEIISILKTLLYTLIFISPNNKISKIS